MGAVLFLHLQILLVFCTAFWERKPSDAFVLSPTAVLANQPRSLQVLYASDEKDEEKSVSDERWDQRIEELKEYEKEFGTVNVSCNHKFYKDEWERLAYWVTDVRQAQARLSKERYDQLTAMGFIWAEADKEKFQRRWMAMFDQLQEYKKLNGDCKVPVKYAANPKLGIWVKSQRAAKKTGTLSNERIEMLDAIGFVWSVIEVESRESSDDEWNSQFKLLKKFYEENGNYWPPKYSNNDQLNRLGRWAKYQRFLQKRGLLRPDRKEELERIGFEWDYKQKREDAWQQKFLNLKEKFEQARAGEVDGNLVGTAVLGDSLYTWAKRQQDLKAKGKLDPDRVARLESINFPWYNQKTNKKPSLRNP